MGALKTLEGFGSRRRTIVWLLAINVFLICGLLAFIIRQSFDEPSSRGKPSSARRIERLTEGLSPEDATALQTEFLRRSDAIEQARERFQRSREAVRQALRAEPYDANAAQTAMSEAENAHRRVEQLMQDLILSAAAKMSAAGRAKLAELHSPGRQRERNERPRFSISGWLSRN